MPLQVVQTMGTIEELEELLGERGDFVSAERKKSREAAVLSHTGHQVLRDDGKTTTVRAGLSKQEFDCVLGLLRNEPELIRGGRRPPGLDIRPVTFMQRIKFGATHKETADPLKLPRSRVQTAITDVWAPVTKVLQDDLPPTKPTGYHSTGTLDNHRHAVGAPDATSMPVAKRLHGAASRGCLPGGHRRCGVRLQVLVAPDGHCVHCGGIVPGRRHGLCCMDRVGWLMEC